MFPKKAKGSNVRVDWSRDVEVDGEIFTEDYIIDALVTCVSSNNGEYYNDGDMEILGVFKKSSVIPVVYSEFDLSNFTEDEVSCISTAVELEYEEQIEDEYNSYDEDEQDDYDAGEDQWWD